MGSSGWRKVRDFFGISACAYPALAAVDGNDDDEEFEPAANDGGEAGSSPKPRKQDKENVNAASAAAAPAPPSTLKHRRRISGRATELELSMDTTTTAPSRSPLQRFRSGSKYSRSTCTICLESMKPGSGHAIFTAECSHAFHFPCIASNVRHGNLFCPVCRAAWKEVPWQAPARPVPGRARSPLPRPLTPRQQEALRNAEEDQQRMEPVLRILDESIATFRGNRQPDFPDEPPRFDDDEAPPPPTPTTEQTPPSPTLLENEATLEITLRPEFEAVASAQSCDMTVLVHVRAMKPPTTQATSKILPSPEARAAVDLVTVLDVSGSMSGGKLLLVKRAMNFVMDMLSAMDRICIVVFSSHARRVLPLRQMTPEGRRAARRVVDALACTGGTNIGEGLGKASKVLAERRHRNPVAGVLLLSDGQDTCCMTPRRPEAQSVLCTAPVHTFGFGIDHDPVVMHRIAGESGGTFSFVQSENQNLLQDAFAQCLGGLLTVALQDIELRICAAASSDGVAVVVKDIHAGSYATDVARGTVQLGDLYADEERHVLVDLHVPSTKALSTDALAVSAAYVAPQQQRRRGGAAETSRKVLSLSLSLARPDVVHGAAARNVEIERQRNRLRTGKAIGEARALADRGMLAGAREALERARASLAPTGDESWRALESELTEVAARMATPGAYSRAGGRAYVLSAHACHLRQRAATRGESMDNLSREYQTPSMVSMISLSQSHSNVAGPDEQEAGAGAAGGQPSTSTSSAWKLAKAAVLRKPSTKVSDLHGFEKAGF